MTIRRLNTADRLLGGVQNALQMMTSAALNHDSHTLNELTGSENADPAALTEPERRLSGALMRVNHVGEVCAQALYLGQTVSARNTAVRAQFEQAAKEEQQHLTWTATRLQELNAHPSRLNPLWYAGSFSLGVVAGAAGDKASLGFMQETENQVEKHLASHLERLPEADTRSRQIVAQMKQDEARHAAQAQQMGATPMPWPIREAMRLAAKAMTSTAHHI